MSADIVTLADWQPVLVEHQFTCELCSANVFSAVHLGHRRRCYMCQHLDPDVREFLRGRAP